MAMFGTSEMAGGSLTGVTVTVKRVLALAPAGSVTTRVIVALPKRLGEGEMTTVRLVSMPADTILLVGTSEGSEDCAVSVKDAAVDSRSDTVKGRAAVEVSSAMV